MSYESAMEERILKTFKSKDDLIRKLQAEKAELVDMLEEVEDLIEQHTKRDGVLMALINWAKKARRLKGE